MPELLLRTVEHLAYSGVAVLIAVVVGIPLGLVIARTSLADAVLASAGALRALPSLAVLTLLTLYFGIRTPLLPTTIVLLLLAIPPLLAATVAGVRNIPPDVTDAAQAMGFTEGQLLLQVSAPLALPTIIGGLRSCVLQVLSTATIAAFIGLGGLGRYVIDGLAVYDYFEVLTGALTVTALALVADTLLAILQRRLR
ncbi:ABC transporter permease [Corynebacterium canis]|uniref:ABC transporter permease n=1 Tax=Corynebacterium canis TaxID=679663 RepID=A0A5C5UKU3_9CORY|nr:ABC transporter permease [Corynebacterium canis]TWT26608.1 ABC transporter permease [Corynebacterium canis]WJY76390.1 Carnitine transport permease protein OpuCB [Corynebacterium canis]